MHIDKYLDSSQHGRYFYGEVLEYFRLFLLSLDKNIFELVYQYIQNNPIKANLDDINKRIYTIY